MRMRITQIYKERQQPVRGNGELGNSSTRQPLDQSSSFLTDSFNSSVPGMDKKQPVAFKDLFPDQVHKASLIMAAVFKAQKCPCMAVKVFACDVSIPSIRSILRLHWGPAQFGEVEATADACIFRVTMKMVKDKKLVLQKRLWDMTKFLVLIEDWKVFEAAKEMCFRYAEIRIQLLNLPRQIRREDVIRNILQKVGEVVSVSLFLGIPVALVRMDLRRPFWPAVPVVFSGHPLWILIAYENLKNVCFKCGFLGHSGRQCRFVSKPFACQFNAANPDFPFHKLGKRMQEFSLVSEEPDTVFFQDTVQTDEIRESDESVHKNCERPTPIEADTSSGSQKTGVEVNKVEASSLDSRSGDSREAEVLIDKVGEAKRKINLVTTYKAEEITLESLSNKLNFGEPFCPTTSRDIFRLTQGAKEKIESAQVSKEESEERQQLNSFLNLCSKGKYPLTNFFTPQYSIFVAQFLRRKEAKLVFQVTLDEEEPTILVHQNFFKAPLKTYQRRPRVKVNSEIGESSSQSGAQSGSQLENASFASPPIPKVRKLHHFDDCDLDAVRDLEPTQDTEDTRERKKPSQKGTGNKAGVKNGRHKFLARRLFVPSLETIEESEEESVQITEDFNRWHLSEGEEIALSVLSKGLREVDEVNLSQRK